MFRNLDAEQARLKLTNSQVAEKLGITRVTYENKKRNGLFTRPQITTLLNLFGCTFEYLFDVNESDKHNTA